MKVFYKGELVEASPMREAFGGPIFYQIGREFVGADEVVIPSADVQSGKVPPTPFSETGDDVPEFAKSPKGK